MDPQAEPMHALRARDFEAAVFDLDGVVTRTASVHAAAWKELFDAYLEQVSAGSNEPFRAFDADEDYRRFVDGKPRYEGVKSFLESRGITLPYGDPEDPPERETICGLGNRKNALFHERLTKDGVEVFESSVKLVRTLRERGLKTALVSSSKNAKAVLQAAGLTDLFDAIVDGVEAARLGLKGKPNADIFLHAAELLGVAPEHALAVEDAIAGVEAARAGGFGLVIGVARSDDGAALRANGADLVVGDLAELGGGATLRVRPRPDATALPNALDRATEIRARLAGKRPAVFLDSDGTLTPSFLRPFRLITFDWEGTAVESRRDDATPVRGPIERLLRSGVLVVAITEANLQDIEGQLSSGIRGLHKRNLYLATNGGAEVYGFDERSRPVAVWRCEATAEEERLLTEVAEAVRLEVIARTGLDVGVVYDRSNRRAVDLIPVERWQDPQTSANTALLAAVEARLKGAGLAGGLHEVIALARRIAAERGLQARITSDVKHVVIGLTDKGDSVVWVLRELAEPRGIDPRDMLIVGDAFAPVAGFPGSDSRMLLPELREAAVVSVGLEPGGTPPNVVHLGGGPARFRELLAAQAALHPVDLPAAPTAEPEWVLIEEGSTLTREHELESLFAIGNGYVGSRGSLAEGSPLSAPATFVAGVFDSEPGSVPSLAAVPDWAHLSVAVEGHPLRLDVGKALEHRRILDLRQGILWREWRHQDTAGRVTRLRGLRLASLADRHLLIQSVILSPENYSGTVSVDATLTGSLTRLTAAGTTIAVAAAGRIEDPEGRWMGSAEPAAGQLSLDVELGKTYRLDRLCALHTSRDTGRPVEAAREHAERAIEADVAATVGRHRDAWLAKWSACDIRIDGDPAAQHALRFAVYHLLSAANPEDDRVSIGARALTGGAYKGHVFWDTEIFMLPFFTLTYPEAARALLMYRYHTLPAARAKAARLGYRGALYAWESADTGEEVTPPFVVAPDGEVVRILVGEQEQHISADIAYGVWSYWRATGDERFLVEAGAEILLETARFWASRAERDEDGRYHIRGVIGPDEYHESVDDNAYTNGMARWNLEIGEVVARLVAERWPERWQALSGRLSLDSDEPRQWLNVARDLYTGFDERTGLIEQFQGYFGLEEIDLAAFAPRSAPMDVLLGRERVQRSKIIKQPDVVILLHLLWDRFPPEVREANFRYYEPRCGHGSSLSPAIHALVAARLGDVALAERYFRQAMEIDLADNMGNAAGGVHAAALGGLWQAAVFGFAGLHLTDEGPEYHPNLPPHWRGLSLRFRWRGQRHELELPAKARAVEPRTKEANP